MGGKLSWVVRTEARRAQRTKGCQVGNLCHLRSASVQVRCEAVSASAPVEGKVGPRPAPQRLCSTTSSHMSSPPRILRTDLRQLQVTTRARWVTLLGFPRLCPMIYEELKPLGAAVRPVGWSLDQWRQLSTTRVSRVSQLETARGLARRLVAYDRLGRAANRVHEITEHALQCDPSVSASAHIVSIRHAKRRYIKMRNRLLVNGLGFIDDVLRDIKCPADRVADMRHEGFFGLLRAVESHDPERSRDFPCTARWWIRRSVRRALRRAGRHS